MRIPANLFWTILLIPTLIGCSNNDLSSEDDGSDGAWLIPAEAVFDGGPGKDGIPSIDDPQFSPVDQIQFLEDSDLVIGVIHQGQAKAYPHPILDWHEIVNDRIGDYAFSLTYCPLTGTGLNWNRVVDGQETTFGVSGKLFNTNLMPYDRATDSYWSQLELQSVHGEKIGTNAQILPAIETSWETWKKMHPEAMVLNTNTGFSRNYQRYPYGDYRTNDQNILFPVDPMDTRLPAKDRVLAVLGNTVKKAYPLDLFEEERVILDNIDGEQIVVIGSKERNFIVAYERGLMAEPLQVVKDESNIIAEDADGNRLTLDGLVLSGPQGGKELDKTNSFIGFWFALGAFYPDIVIYTE